jgi:hypothetical protein
MRKLICGLTLLLQLFCFTLASAQPVASSELISKTKVYDGKIVVYEGEAVGDVMNRGSFSWVNLYDGQNTIGCWIDSALAKTVAFTGSHRNKGDLLEIIGIFHRSCPDHGGDLDIHAQALRKIRPGRVVLERINSAKIEFAVTLLFILGAVWILNRLKSK